ncbi:hypothetical protein CFP75_33325 [Amycolatopsis alba DSM 44262]|uniref:Uncharacterized protein n=1 Tax=Amycolatopsis alba DSM 44262 TaxID=1125972 RepID=A0A229RDS7_AMYAL|nr:hypothetical protein CFP75_33325 [Amycolatopsis alba DSM 44262]
MPDDAAGVVVGDEPVPVQGVEQDRHVVAGYPVEGGSELVGVQRDAAVDQVRRQRDDLDDDGNTEIGGTGGPAGSWRGSCSGIRLSWSRAGGTFRR